MASLNVLFFGTPHIAVPFLDWLIKNTNVVGVVCRPDEPSGRGQKISAPPTKIRAVENNIPSFQPTGPWTPEMIGEFKNLKADIGIVVAYGRILPPAVFSAPRLGSINLHFSLLPKYRGAAPMQWALINGESKTGVSAFWLEAGLDSGPLFYQSAVAIDPEDNLPRLREKLVPAGVAVLERVIGDVAAGRLVHTPQQGEMSLAPILKKEMGRVAWERPAPAIANLVRGLCEWPGVSTTYRSADGTTRQLKITRARAMDRTGGPASGTIVEMKKNEGLVVACGEGQLLISELQPEGKKPMAAEAFWLGARLKIGDHFA
jgi:methionyl-tRNA formyltransferase